MNTQPNPDDQTFAIEEEKLFSGLWAEYSWKDVSEGSQALKKAGAECHFTMKTKHPNGEEQIRQCCTKIFVLQCIELGSLKVMML